MILRANTGENFLEIPAGVTHRITAEEDDTLVHCVYANRTPQGEIVQHYTGWEKAYI